MKCNRGQKEGKQIKAGKIRAESQIYKCKYCGKNSSNERVKVIEMDELYTYA